MSNNKSSERSSPSLAAPDLTLFAAIVRRRLFAIQFRLSWQVADRRSSRSLSCVRMVNLGVDQIRTERLNHDGD
jgi:hypothetical protein